MAADTTFSVGDWVTWRELELRYDWQDTWGDRQRGCEREEGWQIVEIKGHEALVRISVTEDRWVALWCLRRTAAP